LWAEDPTEVEQKVETLRNRDDRLADKAPPRASRFTRVVCAGDRHGHASLALALVEAVGIEQPAVHLVSPILQGFSRTAGVRLSAKEHCAWFDFDWDPTVVEAYRLTAAGRSFGSRIAQKTW
jgi:hypothetical protein